MAERRRFLKAGAALALLGPSLGRAEVRPHLSQGHDFGPPPAVAERLEQGPFGIEQDEGWYTIATTTPSGGRVRNPGLGLVGYTWEENGPPLAVRAGSESLEQAIEALAGLPFVDLLYIRCDWRDVQSRPGRLDLHGVWAATRDAARRHGLRIAFRVQLSNPEIQPARLALPDFLQPRVPLVKVRSRSGRGPERVEPRYDHPAFQQAFRELNELLAAELDQDPLVEFADLMMYGFWGEGHTSDYPSPFPDARLAERTFLDMTEQQLAAWRRVPLVVNTQPDISRTGNRSVLDRAVLGGAWLRSDSVILDEPEQIEELAQRPPWLAVVMEDGYHRHYRTDDERYRVDAAGVDVIEHTMLHALDVGANYWSLWTEATNLRSYRERRPMAFDELERRIGYRVRPSWIWQRKRGSTDELIVAVFNDGAASVPGVLRVSVELPDGTRLAGGGLDAGHPFAGRVRLASLRLPRRLGASEVRLRAELVVKGVRRPVRWACAQPLSVDGALAVRLKDWDETDWRKGI